MNNKAFIPLILLLCFLSGYAWEFFPYTTWIAPFDSTKTPLTLQWWSFVGFLQLKSSVMAWSLWYFGIPKEKKLLRLGTGVVCIFLTLIPLNFILFYFPPFKEITFVVKTTIGIAIVFIVTYGYGLYKDLRNSSLSD